MSAYDCPQHPYPSPLCLVQEVEHIARRETIVGYLPGTRTSQPEPRRWMQVIAALAFMVGLAVPVVVALWAVLAVWLNR